MLLVWQKQTETKIALNLVFVFLLIWTNLFTFKIAKCPQTKIVTFQNIKCYRSKIQTINVSYKVLCEIFFIHMLNLSINACSQ